MTAPPTAPTAPVVGNSVSSGIFGTATANCIAFLLAPPRTQVVNSATLSPANNTWTLHTWDTENWDTDTMHSIASNTSRIQATTSGLYEVVAQVAFTSNATGSRGIQVRKGAGGNVASGTLIEESLTSAAVGSTATTVSLELDVQMAAGDYLEAFIYQNSGGALATIAGQGWSWMQARWVASS